SVPADREVPARERPMLDGALFASDDDLVAGELDHRGAIGRVDRDQARVGAAARAALGDGSRRRLGPLLRHRAQPITLDLTRASSWKYTNPSPRGSCRRRAQWPPRW